MNHETRERYERERGLFEGTAYLVVSTVVLLIVYGLAYVTLSEYRYVPSSLRLVYGAPPIHIRYYDAEALPYLFAPARHLESWIRGEEVQLRVGGAVI